MITITVVAVRSRPVLKLTAALLVIAGLLIWVFSDGKQATCTLADGSILAIESVRFGRTNVFVDGTALEKGLRWVLPTNGVKLLGRSLRPPVERRISRDEGEILVLRLSLSKPKLTENPFFQSPQQADFVTLESETGHRYLLSFGNGLSSTSEPDEFRAFVTFTAFPRDRKRLTLDFLDTYGISFAKLTFKNPAQLATRQEWKSSPRTNVGGMDVEFGAVRLPQPGTRLIRGRMPKAIIPVRIQAGGRVLTNWTITDLSLRDPTGNFLTWLRPRKTITSDWQEYALTDYLDPAKPWQLDFNLTKDADFDSDERCVVIFPDSLIRRQQPFGDYTLEVHRAGTKPSSSHEDYISVDLWPTNSDVRLTLIDAHDTAGDRVSPGPASSGQHGFSCEFEDRRIENGIHHLTSLAPGTTITVIFAIHTNYHASVIMPPAPRTVGERDYR